MIEAISIEERGEIPLSLRGLEDFRIWVQSKGFPDRGRIDYLAGRIEVNMSPEDFFSQGVVKVEVARVVGQHVKEHGMGYLVSDRTRVSCPAADLSVEPDLVFVSHDGLDAARVRLVPAGSGAPDRFVEVEGAPGLVVEIVSDSSEVKDGRRLPPLYFAAGVREFWFIDARGSELVFRIFRRGEGAFEPSPEDADGFQYSAVMGVGYALRWERDRRGLWSYDLVAGGVATR